jgi:glycosyltransferase involved in cell wall biosynthesis
MLIDITRLLDRSLRGRIPTGVDRVSLEYVSHFGHAARALVRFGGRWIVPSPGDSRRLFDALTGLGPDLPRVARWCVGKAYVSAWHRCLGPDILLNAGHSGLDRPEYAARIRQHELTPLIFLHDLIPITHPEYCRAGEAVKHRLRLETILRVGGGLIVNSRATRDELARYAGRIGRSLPPCVVAPLAPGRLPAPNDKRPLKAPYFVMVGTIEPRKNHLLLLHLWRLLVTELGAGAPHLVIIGQRGWECEQVVDLLERCEAIRGFVHEQPGCGDQALATWLRHAQALLFPSFAEGFGMPLVEALAFGVPVIASKLPTFREVAGDVPDYLDPLDGPAWRDAILAYADTSNLRRSSQLDRIRGYKAPTWDDHFTCVEGLLRQIQG